MSTYNNGSAANNKSYADQASYAYVTGFTWLVSVYQVTQPTNGTFLSKDQGSTQNDSFLGTISTGGNQFRAVIRGSDNATHAAIDPATNSTATWYRLGMRYNGSTLSLWKDGVSVATNTPGGGFTQANNASAVFAIGARSVVNTASNPCDAWLAEFGAFAVDLTDEEMVSHGKGACPLLLRPSSIVLYDSLINLTTNDVFNGVGTFAGTMLAEPHAPVAYRPRRRLVPKATAGGNVSGAGTISPADSFAATSAALKASAGAISPADSFAATTAALKQAAGAISPADAFDATSKALKASAGAISPADSFGAGSTKLAASPGSFSPADVIAATSAALKAAAGNFSPGDSFGATANSAGSDASSRPADSFAATGAERAAGAGSWLPGDSFAATALELGAAAGSFSPADTFPATGAALRAGVGSWAPTDSFAATGAKRAASAASCSPADSFGATSASLVAAVGNISPADDFSARSPSVGGAGSAMFLTTAR